MEEFQAGRLLELAQTTSRNALESGGLWPVRTRNEFILDRGIRFLVRVAEHLRHKPAAPSGGAQPNPFLPPDPQLTVAAVPPRHWALLNKFPVVADHLLIVTREFESQESRLSGGDFQALAACLSEFPGLGFYNSGRVAGASQPHKHLQLIPLPLTPDGPTLPIAPWIEVPFPPGSITTCPQLPYPHALAALPPPERENQRQWSDAALAAYSALLDQFSPRVPLVQKDPAFPYNLLITREWMLLVPRRREHFRGLSLNAMAFGGAFLVWHESQLEILREMGPIRALQETAGLETHDH